MTQIMQYAATYKVFDAALVTSLTDGMIAQAITRTAITTDSILEVGERRTTTVPDIMHLAEAVEFSLDPASTSTSYNYCTAKKAYLRLTATSPSSVIVMLLEGQEMRVKNDGNGYIRVYPRRIGPIVTAGVAPIQHLGQAITVGPNEHKPLP
jgi:hypothetical protein